MLSNCIYLLIYVHLLNLQCNVPLTRGPSAIAEPLVIVLKSRISSSELRGCHLPLWQSHHTMLRGTRHSERLNPRGLTTREGWKAELTCCVVLQCDDAVVGAGS